MFDPSIKFIRVGYNQHRTPGYQKAIKLIYTSLHRIEIESHKKKIRSQLYLKTQTMAFLFTLLHDIVQYFFSKIN